MAGTHSRLVLRTVSLLLLLSCAAATEESKSAYRCVDGYVRYNLTCIKLFKDIQRIFFDARLYCKSENGHLLSIENEAKSSFVTELVRNVTGDIWIGLWKYSGRYEQYRWYGLPSNTRLTYRHWRTKQNKLDRLNRCVTIHRDGWWDSLTPCEDEKSFICERKTTCASGHFGPHCSQKCHCYGEPCDAVTGLCTLGCQVGWMGTKCNIVKRRAKMSVHCFNSPVSGKYLDLRVDTNGMKYANIVGLAPDGKSTKCGIENFSRDFRIDYKLRIDIYDNGTVSPECGHIKLKGEIYKLRFRLQEKFDLLSAYDAIFKVKCDFTKAETLQRENNVEVSGLMKPGEENVEEIKEDVTLAIRDPATGTTVIEVPIGTSVQLAMKMEIKGHALAATGISPFNCMVSTPDGRVKLYLTDKNGCPSDKSPISSLKLNGTVVVSKVFEAFTIDGASSVTFRCYFEYCYHSDGLCSDSKQNHQLLDMPLLDENKARSLSGLCLSTDMSEQYISGDAVQ